MNVLYLKDIEFLEFKKLKKFINADGKCDECSGIVRHSSDLLIGQYEKNN